MEASLLQEKYDSEPKKEYSVNELNQIRDKIESMSKFNQVEILRLLQLHNETITFNENKYGIHVNLSEVDSDVILKLENYIHYVNTQEITLNQVEKQKENFKNTYFTKESTVVNNLLHHPKKTI